jgi:hypothetical protein
MSAKRTISARPFAFGRLGWVAALAAVAGACATEPTTVATSAAAVARPAAQRSSTASEATAADAHEVVCREIEVTGTRFGQRICRTRAEWNIVENQQRQAAREYTRQTRENAAILNPVESRGEFGSPTSRFPTTPTQPP